MSVATVVLRLVPATVSFFDNAMGIDCNAHTKTEISDLHSCSTFYSTADFAFSRLFLKIKIFLSSGHERVNLFTKRFRIALG